MSSIRIKIILGEAETSAAPSGWSKLNSAKIANANDVGFIEDCMQLNLRKGAVLKGPAVHRNVTGMFAGKFLSVSRVAVD